MKTIIKSLIATALFITLGAFQLSAIETSDTISKKKQKATELKELTVESSNIRQEGDKTVINITKSMRKGTITTEQMLGNIPGFFYEPGSAIKFNNSTNFVILMDSIPKSKSYILNLNNIKFDKIVIVQNPQGEYSGYDYLINIKTHPNYEGYEGNVYALYNQFFNNRSRKGIATFNPSSYAYYTKNKLTLYANANMYKYHTAYNYWNEETFSFDGTSQKIVPNADGAFNTENRSLRMNARMMVDYQFNPKNTLSLQYSYRHDPYHNDNNRTLEIHNAEHPDGETVPYDTWTDSYTNRHAVSLFYRNSMHKVRFNSNVQYTFDNNNYSYRLKQGDTQNFGYHYRNRMNLVNYNIGANTNFGKKSSMYWGYNGVVKDYSQTDYATGNELSSNKFIRNRLYAGFTQQIGNNFYVNLSPSIEFINYSGGGKSYHNTPFGASSYIYYKLTNKVWTRFDYTMSTNYPSQSDVTDWGYFVQPLIWRGGNPALKTSIFHNFYLQANLLNCINIRGGFQTNPDAVFTIGKVETGTLPDGSHGEYLAYRPFNGNYKSFWTQLSFSKWFSKHFSGNTYFNFSHTKMSAAGVRNHANSVKFDFSTRYWNQRYDFNIWFTYVLLRNKGLGPQSVAPFFIENPYITATKFLFNKKLELKLVYGSFFHLFGDSYSRNMTNIAGVYRSNSETPYWERNKIEFSFVYRFWGGKSVKAYEQGISEEK